MEMKRRLILNSYFKRYAIKAVAKGEILVFQGEAPRTAFVIKKGMFKTYNLSSLGDEKPIAYNVELDVIPVPWVFGKATTSLFYYEAIIDSEVYCVPREEYVAFIRSNLEILYGELESFVMNSVGKTMRLNALQHSRASDKLLYTLHYLTLSYGKEIKPNLMEINLKLTHQDFANLTGLTRETTATELSKLKKRGIISYDKRMSYRVKVDKLQSMLKDEFLAELNMATLQG
jgi:CRP/FNR family cyclic AMP-dependent transcriptional regulator